MLLLRHAARFTSPADPSVKPEISCYLLVVNDPFSPPVVARLDGLAHGAYCWYSV